MNTIDTLMSEVTHWVFRAESCLSDATVAYEHLERAELNIVNCSETSPEDRAIAQRGAANARRILDALRALKA